MKYLAGLLFLVMLMTYDGCGQHGLSWTYDGQRHAFGWRGDYGPR